MSLADKAKRNEQQKLRRRRDRAAINYANEMRLKKEEVIDACKIGKLVYIDEGRTFRINVDYMEQTLDRTEGGIDRMAKLMNEKIIGYDTVKGKTITHIKFNDSEYRRLLLCANFIFQSHDWNKKVTKIEKDCVVNKVNKQQQASTKTMSNCEKIKNRNLFPK